MLVKGTNLTRGKNCQAQEMNSQFSRVGGSQPSIIAMVIGKLCDQSADGGPDILGDLRVRLSKLKPVSLLAPVISKMDRYGHDVPYRRFSAIRIVPQGKH